MTICETNAVHKKSRVGVGSTGTANWNDYQKTLCIYSTPKKPLKQRLSHFARRWAL